MSAPGATPRWEELARSAREPGATGTRPLRALLCFRVDAEACALPVEAVREIVRLRPLTPIPRVTSAVRGVISLRGEMLQLIDLRRRLGLGACEPGPRARILVVGGEGAGTTGLLVDSVSEVLRVPEEAIGPGLGDEASSRVRGMFASGGGFVSLLDLERILDLDGDG